VSHTGFDHRCASTSGRVWPHFRAAPISQCGYSIRRSSAAADRAALPWCVGCLLVRPIVAPLFPIRALCRAPPITKTKRSRVNRCPEAAPSRKSHEWSAPDKGMATMRASTREFRGRAIWADVVYVELGRMPGKKSLAAGAQSAVVESVQGPGK